MSDRTDSGKPISLAWWVVVLLFPVALLNYLDRQMIASMKTSVVADLPGLELDAQWGYMLGQFKWCYAFFSPIGGLLADRLSRKWTIGVSLVCWSIVTYLTGSVDSYSGLLWTRTAMGISEAFYIPAALALISDFHGNATRSKAVGIHQMGIYCGVILGGFAGFAADSDAVGWRGAFHWVGLLGVVYALPLMWKLPHQVSDTGRTPENGLKKDESAGDGSPDFSADFQADPSSRQPSSRQALHTPLLLTPSFYLLVIYFTLPALSGWVVRDWMPSMLKTGLNISQGLAGVSASLYWQASALVAAVGGGWIADRWSRRSDRARIYVSAIGTALIIPSMIMVGIAIGEKSLLAAIAALVLFGIGWGCFDCNNMPILCQIASPRSRATGYGIMNFVSISCGGLADWGVGKMLDRQWPLMLIFGLLSGLCLVSVALVLLIRPRVTDRTAVT